MVYLPHCGESASRNFLADLRLALLMAFGDSSAESQQSRKQISDMKTFEDLLEYADNQPPSSLLLVLDQFNSIQEDGTTIGQQDREEAWRILRLVRRCMF